MALRPVLSVLLVAHACAHAKTSDETPPANPPSTTRVAPAAPAVDEASLTRATCLHVGQVAASSGVAQADVIALESACMARFEQLHAQPDTFARCLRDTSAMNDVSDCEQQLRDVPGLLGPVLTTSAEVCDHVLTMMQRELGEALPMSAEELAEFRAECVKDMEVERSKMGDVEFHRQADCVLRAQGLADMEKCDRTKK